MKNRITSKILVAVMFLFAFLILTACKPDPIIIIEKVAVIFDVNAGDDVVQNEPAVVRIDKDSAVTRPTPDPIRNGYDFVGWYENAAGEGESYDFTKPVTRNNFVLYAIWRETVLYHTVTFDYLGAATNVNQQIADGKKVIEPAAPTRDGYRFEGWYIDSNFNTKFNFASEVDNSFTLYANWIEQFKVAFNLNYTDAPTAEEQTVDINNIATRPTAPRRDDYTFVGWFVDRNGDTPYEFDEVTANITVYAKWIASGGLSYTVEFDYNYDNAPDNVTQEIAEGGVVEQPATNRENYRFLGWYLDNNTFEQRFNLSTPITGDLTLYARWTRQYKITYHLNYQGASDSTVVLVDQNTSITPIHPSRIGYVFAGWSDAANGSVGFEFGLGIDQDTTVYAQWSRDYVFEAEYLNFDDFAGWGFSGNATGTQAILEDISGQAEASNGRFVTYLYGSGITLEYTIYSDRDVDNVKLTLRLSAEIKDIYIQSAKGGPQDPTYTVKVNDQAIDYGMIDFLGVPQQGLGEILPFEDFTISTTVSLKAGENRILLITDNELLMGGTMQATAPMVDCIKLETYAILTWEPKLDNY